MPKEKSEIKVGDYVHVLIVGFNRKQDYESAYRIESIDGDDYTALQKEGTYEHRVTVKIGKLRKL